MRMNEYQRDAMRTAQLVGRSEVETLTEAALGLSGESGEFSEAVKKHKYHRHEMNAAQAALEIGDVLWYCALAATALGLTLEEVAEMNLAKLRARYPDGFDSERSVNRSV